MVPTGTISRVEKAAKISLFDLVVAIVVTVGGFVYHGDGRHWAIGLVGDTQYGDALFWWSGALHVSEGIFTDHPGRGFRPGYFVLTGLTLPVLGDDFFAYHKYFLTLFLASGVFFYLAARRPLGRYGAACALALLVFNPVTAEWLATPTTDGTGLLLHLLALACLVLGTSSESLSENGPRPLRYGWLLGFGVLFALATLTRPIVTPFIGLALVALLLQWRLPFRQRVLAAATVILAFCAPTLLWLAVQRLTIGEWSLSNNDASAFYAASDPNIQVWEPYVAERVKKLAQERFGVTHPDRKHLNQVFWSETYANYRTYFRYHVERLLPHLWQVACVSPKAAGHGTRVWQACLLSLLAAGLSLRSYLEGSWARAGLLLGAGIGIALTPWCTGLLICAGTVVALVAGRRQRAELASVLLACYWLTGVAALFVVGGTSGPPLGTATYLNSLGYRLGAQIFFVGELLAVYSLCWLASLNLVPVAAANRLSGTVKFWQAVYSRPRRLAGAAVVGSLSIAAAFTVLILLVGGTIVAKRYHDRQCTVRRPYPDLHEIAEAWQTRTATGQTPEILATFDALNSFLYPDDKAIADSGDVIATAAVSPFIWNLEGQERAHFLLYYSDCATPFPTGLQCLYLQAPRHLEAAAWQRAQGAFVLRRFTDRPSDSYLPYFNALPAVRAFIPLDRDGRTYALDQAVCFPLVKYASQLAAARELHARHGTIQWVVDASSERYKRRFLLTPEKESPRVCCLIDIAKASGDRRLTFAYKWQAGPAGETELRAAKPQARVWALGGRSEHRRQLWPEPESNGLAGSLPGQVDIDLSAHDAVSLEIEFDALPPGASVCVYELNLSAGDFAHASPARSPTTAGEPEAAP